MGLKEKEDGQSPCKPSGLALLLSGGSGGALLPESDPDDEVAAAAHVFNFQEPVDSGDGMYVQLSKFVAQRARHERSGPNYNAADERFGRLGPSCVEVDHVSGQLESSASGTLISTANFSSCRANACVFAGKWQYETTICSEGIMQIGWATLQCPFTSEEGVGDAPDSYAFDGKRIKKWHVKCTHYGEAWASGDVIGCCLDLDRGEATFYRNGRSLGVAFTGIRTMQPLLAYFPAVSLSYAERCELNFGAQPLQYPVPGYQPMQAPPPPGVVASASYLVGCLERLVTATHPRGGSTPSTAGAASSSHSASSGGSSGYGYGYRAAAGTAAASCDQRADGTPAGGGPGRASQRPSFMLPWDSWLLLGSIAVDQLAPHLLDAHLIAAVLMPALLRLTANGGGAGTGAARIGAVGPDSGLMAAAGAPASPVAAFLQLLELCLEPELLSAVVNCLLEALSRRCVSAALVPEQFPYSASCPYLALAAAIAARPALRSVWLRHPNMWQVLEGFLTRKAPSPDDQRQLLPHVWWRGCSELSGDRERMRGALQALSTAITRVEDKQYELLSCLLGSPGAGDPREDALVEFLRYLVHKNRGATRDIPPPGLSDSTVLISAYFVLVRMLRVALPQVDSFPAGSLFVKTAMKADLEPVNSLARLGGIVTHLCRESPVTSPAELAPLAVTPPQPTQIAPPPAGCSPAAAAGPGPGSGPGLGPGGAPGAASPSSHPSASTTGGGGGGGASGGSPSQLPPPPWSQADAWVVSRMRACPRLASELVDLAMTLYAFKVGSSIKMMHNRSSSVAASLAGVEEVERQLRRTGRAGAAPGGPAGAPPSSISTSSSSSSSSADVAYLQEVRELFRKEVSEQIRYASLLKIVFFSGWKQEASLALAAWLSRMLTAAAALPGPLLSYVPSCYLDCILDTVTSMRHATEAASGTALPPAALAPSVAALRTHGSLGDIIAVLATLLHEPRICTPDAKEALVLVLVALLDQPGMMAEAEANEVARRRLVGAAVAAFDSRQWHLVALLLLHLVRGQGFGEQQQLQRQQAGAEAEAGPGSRASPLASLGRVLAGVAAAASPGTSGQGGSGSESAGGGAAGGSALFRELLVSELRPDGPALQPFLHRLFNVANWANTEFAAIVADLQENRSRRLSTEQPQQYRKAGMVFELGAGLLRLLEFTATHLPAGFVGVGPHAVMNLNRLLEVISFVLSHFTEGSDARRLTELLTVPPDGGAGGGGGGIPPSMNSSVRTERNLLSEKVNRVQVLAPVVGALLGLWRGSAPGAAAQHAADEAGVSFRGDSGGVSSTSTSGSGGGSGGVCGGGGGGGGAPGGSVRSGRRQVLLDALLRHWDAHSEKQMAYLRAMDWRGALPGADQAALDAGAREFAELLAAAAARRQQLSAIAAGAGGGGGGGGEEAPEELLDPITSTLMTDPVVLPDSQVTVDRTTIERHFLTSMTDPFSRTPLTREALRSDEELKRKTQDWLKSRGRA